MEMYSPPVSRASRRLNAAASPTPAKEEKGRRISPSSTTNFLASDLYKSTGRRVMPRASISLIIWSMPNSPSSLGEASRFLIFTSRSFILRNTASLPRTAVTPSKSSLRTVK